MSPPNLRFGEGILTAVGRRFLNLYPTAQLGSRRHMWVKFVVKFVGSLLCSGNFGFPLSSKTNI